MADDGSDEEIAKLMRRARIREPPVARPAPRRPNPFEPAAPVIIPRFAPPAGRPQGTKRKYARMLAGYGRKICPKCHGYL
jgi:hypothetical protein